MTNFHNQLREFMDRLLSKLYSLSQPLSVEGQVIIGPLPGEIRASAELMGWFANTIDQLIKEFSDQKLKARKNLPNKQDFSNFIFELEQLKNADEKKRKQLINKCTELMKVLPGIGNGKPHQRTFLPTEAQWELYQEPVISFYNNYKKEKHKHKAEVVLWAAVYEVLVQRTNLKSSFCGPDFDEFIYDFCAIPYNASSKGPRGRYRRVEEVWKDCTENHSQSIHRKLYDYYLSKFRQHLSNSLP